MAKLDQGWYELAADVIASSYTRPEERIEKLNEIWGEYLLTSLELNQIKRGSRATANMLMIRTAFEDAIQIYTGVPLQQIMDYAKEIKANGKNETHEAAADPEQLG